MSISSNDERREGILAKAREILARQPTPAEIEEDEARRQRLTVDETMPDLTTLQARWISGDHLSDEQYRHMRRLEALAKIAPPPPPNPVTVTRKAPRGRPNTTRLQERARKAELEIKLKSGSRWTEHERAEWLVIRGMEICDKTDILVNKNQIDDAIAVLVKEIMAISFSQTRNREKLEDRLSALEVPTTTRGEKVTVTKHDERGRILEFVKIPYQAPLKSEGEPMKPRVRVKAIQEVIA